MKHLKRIFESKEQELEELNEVCVWMSDHVDTLEIESNGEGDRFRYYNIEIAANYGKTDITEVLEYTEKLTEIIKELKGLFLT